MAIILFVVATVTMAAGSNPPRRGKANGSPGHPAHRTEGHGPSRPTGHPPGGHGPGDLLVAEGMQTFRYDTFGDEAFWGGVLRLHDAVATLSPMQVLALGLKVDSDALP